VLADCSEANRCHQSSDEGVVITTLQVCQARHDRSERGTEHQLGQPVYLEHDHGQLRVGQLPQWIAVRSRYSLRRLLRVTRQLHPDN